MIHIKSKNCLEALRQLENCLDKGLLKRIALQLFHLLGVYQTGHHRTGVSHGQSDKIFFGIGRFEELQGHKTDSVFLLHKFLVNLGVVGNMQTRLV